MSQIDVTIMGQPFKLACKEGEQDELVQAAKYLDDKMCTIREASKVKGTDRIAVMAALSIATELLSAKAPEGPFSGFCMTEMNKQIAQMNAVLDKAINSCV